MLGININYDAGTLRPTEHGEVWVTEDGGEIDQDLGHYERFLDINIPKSHNITTGQVYYEVIKKERAGKYLGQTVQPIPHVTDEIKRRFREFAKENPDFVLIEIGGTVGDYENILFLEAARQMKFEGETVLFIHVTYVPVPPHIGEAKTKPTQHSVKQLREVGIQPDFVICRSEGQLDKVRKKKIAIFCNVSESDVISNPNVEIIYELPIIFKRQNLGKRILEKLNLKPKRSDLKDWKLMIERIKRSEKHIKIGIVGKYFDIGEFQLLDAYVSVIEAVKHAAWYLNVKPEIIWIDSKTFEENKMKLNVLSNVDGIIVPGGFGSSGVEGKILAIEYCRNNKIPYLGLCFGLQLAIVEFARNVCGLKGAHSTEIDPDTPYPVVDILPEQKKLLKDSKYGATMRLGSYPAKMKKGTLIWKLYGKKDVVYERHRHRWEINPEFHDILQENGLVFSGMSPDRKLVEFAELPTHPYMVGTQAHPEFKSRFMKPSPLFLGLIEKAINLDVQN